jgi:acyl-CoA synthetase (AMP-forming)/AMP-acid ligase II
VTALLEGGGRPALISPDDGRVLTHADVAAVVQRLAQQLRALGVGRGDRVALAMSNGPEFVETLVAIMALGAAAAPLNPAYTEAEFRFYLDDLRPRLLLVPMGRLNTARRAAGHIHVADIVTDGRKDPRIARDGTEVHGARTFEPGSSEDTALLLHTSGTTSRPKQVPLLQRNLMASARSMASHYLLGEEDVSYCAMPLFHVHGLIGSTLAQLAARGAVVTPRRFTAKRFWKQAHEYGVTWFSAGPTTHHMILEHAGDPVRSLRFVRSCSSALTPALMERIEDAHGAPVLEAYGMTEASHQITSNPLPPARRAPGSVGVSAGAEVRIVDQDWVPLPPGTEGEVAVRGPGITPGYLDNEAANAESFADGWFRTGDRGVLSDGYLRLRGRIKEMIIRGGENISPYEIEEVIKSHPAVSDAVCFGIDDAKYGQVVAAAVTLVAAAGPDELREHCRGALAGFKVPESIHVVDAIPRTPTGKVQRRLLAVEFSRQRA